MLSQDEIKAIAEEVVRQLLPILAADQVEITGSCEPVEVIVARRNDAIRDLSNWRHRNAKSGA